MTEPKFDRLSKKEMLAWRMRYHYGWRMKRIALKLGLTPSGASKLVGRATRRAGLPPVRISVIRTKPRRATVISLSDAYNV